MYTALYRTERPETFDQVLGQEHIVRILKNQVKSETVGHAYLFCGTRGTGKTSVARILAKAVNCTGEEEGLVEPGQGKPCCKCASCQAIQRGSFLDVIEIDAASNNGVDNVRELRESVNYPPSVGKRKVYIIDEAHELTTHALNALLKTLEEPPENVMFILATTDPQKLIQTILSRCLRLDFHRISEGDLKNHMANICAKRNVEITDDALNLLTANADGSARDALSLLDQCLSGGEGRLDRDTVLDYLGTVSDDFFIKLTDRVTNGDPSTALIMLDEVLRDGKDVKQILSDWMGHYRSLLIGKYISSPENILNMSGENVAKLSQQAESMSLDEINQGILTLAETVNNARYSPQPRILMELAIVTLAEGTTAPKVAPAQETKAKPAPAPKEAPKAAPAAAPIAEKPEKQVAPEQKATPVADKSEQKAAPAAEAPELKSAPVAEAPEPKTAPATEALATASSADDLDDMWSQVWDKIHDLGSVTMVRINSKLAGVSEKEFKLLITNQMTVNIAEKNRGVIETAMADVLGRPVKMVIKKVDKVDQDVQESLFDEPKEDDVDELKKELESKFNIQVRIEE